jgi:shikimate 5-dehydrogenase
MTTPRKRAIKKPVEAVDAEAAVAAIAGTPVTATAPTVMGEDKTDMFLRQRGLVNMTRLESMPITVIGAGGIGSGVLLALAQMGARNITVYDDDVLETHNISNQVYPMTFVGKNKVEAASDFIQLMYGFKIKTAHKKYDGLDDAKMVISGVDSMAARAQIWELIKVHKECVFYMDARMGGLNFEVYNVTMINPNTDAYERSLVSDDVALDLPCTARSIGFNVLMIGGYVASLVRNFLARQSMPHHVKFDLATNTFEKLA